MSVRVEGVDKITRMFTDAHGKIDKEAITVLRRAAVKVRRRQKQLAPVEDGDLKRAITYRIRGTKWRRTALIGPRAIVKGRKYPLYQEVGTAHMAANPYVRPSLDGMDQEIAAGLNGLVEKALK